MGTSHSVDPTGPSIHGVSQNLNEQVEGLGAVGNSGHLSSTPDVSDSNDAAWGQRGPRDDDGGDQHTDSHGWAILTDIVSLDQRGRDNSSPVQLVSDVGGKQSSEEHVEREPQLRLMQAKDLAVDHVSSQNPSKPPGSKIDLGHYARNSNC